MNEAYFAMRMLWMKKTEKIIDHYFNTYFVFIVAMLAASDMGTNSWNSSFSIIRSGGKMETNGYSVLYKI